MAFAHWLSNVNKEYSLIFVISGTTRTRACQPGRCVYLCSAPVVLVGLSTVTSIVALTVIGTRNASIRPTHQ